MKNYTNNELIKAIALAKECADAAEKSGDFNLTYKFRTAQIELETELVNRRYEEYNNSNAAAAAHQQFMQNNQFDSAVAAHQSALMQQQFDSITTQQNFDAAVQWHMDAAATAAAMNCGMMF